MTVIPLKRRSFLLFLGCDFNEKNVNAGRRKGNIGEKANLVSGFRLRFMDKDENQIIHKVEVRKINFQDLMSHLRHGESVLITPKLLESSLKNANKKDQGSWYFVHT